MKQAILYKKLTHQLIQCQACSWYCKIPAGKLGVCATRLNRHGSLYSLVYGHAVGLQFDPVEKKPLYHFLPGSSLLSFGTLGCNFACSFCQNWDMSQINKDPKIKASIDKLIALINTASVPITPKKLVGLTLAQAAAGIAYTYNEPAIFAEFAHDTAVLARQQGLKNVYVSNGFESLETLNYLKPYLDAINIDLKSFSAKFYQRICRAKIEPVKENIKRFFRSGIETEVTTLVIPGYNDNPKELNAIAKFLFSISPDIPWHLSAFHPDYQLQNAPPTPHATLLQAYDIGKKVGLRYIYLGNLFDSEHSATFCPQCSSLLISRSNYIGQIVNLDLKSGRCRHCAQTIYGTWH